MTPTTRIVIPAEMDVSKFHSSWKQQLPPKRHSRGSGNPGVGRGQTAVFPAAPRLDSRFRGNDDWGVVLHES